MVTSGDDDGPGCPIDMRSTQELIRALPLFHDLSDDDVAQLCQTSHRMRRGPGDLVMREGTPGDGLYIVLEGEIEVSKREAGEDVVLAVRGAGEFLGEMSLLESSPRTASVHAVDEVDLMVIDPAAFQSLLANSPSVATTLIRTVLNRLRSTEASLMQREKLASLGTLAAGLAHELNNPAAAIRRASEHLREALDTFRVRRQAIGALDLSAAQVEGIRGLELQISEWSSRGVVRDALAESLEEGRLCDWLEDRGVSEAWEVAPPLVACGWTTDRIVELADTFPGAAFEPVVRWLASGLLGQELLEEIQRSATAISEIVRAVKTYAYLDQAPVQEVDLRTGIEDTLVMLRHDMKGGVTVTRHFGPDLPRIDAYATELNQVWTNLIQNAVQAMQGKGAIEVHAHRDNDHVEVTIVDNGPGIPDGVKARIFDPFFTTKPPGEGSGLGLHIAYNIVVDKHRGRMSVESRPGRTAFLVRLPIRLRREQGTGASGEDGEDGASGEGGHGAAAATLTA